MIRHAGRLCATMFLASIPTLGALAFGGPAGADDSQAKPRCVALLTADELLKAAGGKFENAVSEVRSSGEAECTWIAKSPAPPPPPEASF